MGEFFVQHYQPFQLCEERMDHLLVHAAKSKVKLPHLLCWRRYIDDVFFLWDGCEDSLKIFLNGLNENDWGVKFTAEYSLLSVDFLDLELTKVTNTIVAKTYFKPTVWNGYVPWNSCHHPNWLAGIPKSQLQRIRRNCTLDADYMSQAGIIADRLSAKGYPQDQIESQVEKYRTVERSSLLKPAESLQAGKLITRKRTEFAFITRYGSQYREINKILGRHWHILREDPVLGPELPLRPCTVFSRTGNIGSKIVKSFIDPPAVRTTFLDEASLKGFHKCGRCMGCKITKKGIKRVKAVRSYSTQAEYPIKEVITCNSTNVVYLLQCPCGLQYIGRTCRTLKTRIREHIYNIKKCVGTHSVPVHFSQAHGSDPSGLWFSGIQTFKPNWRGSNKVRDISKLESSWIFRMDTLSPKGLNIEFDLNCFIDDS